MREKSHGEGQKSHEDEAPQTSHSDGDGKEQYARSDGGSKKAERPKKVFFFQSVGEVGLRIFWGSAMDGRVDWSRKGAGLREKIRGGEQLN